MAPSSPPSVGLVLSGGGSKGAYQAGVYWALRGLGISIRSVAGVSVGAFNGACIAAGKRPGPLCQGWADLERADLFRLNWSGLRRRLDARSVFDEGFFGSFIDRHLPPTFEHLSRPLSVVTTRLSDGRRSVRRDGDLQSAVQASAALPGLLPPVEFDGGHHMDGSLADNLPIDLARTSPDEPVVVVHAQPGPPDPDSLAAVEVIGRAFTLAGGNNLEAAREAPNVLTLRPSVEETIYALDFSHGERLIEAGIRDAAAALRRWDALPLPSVEASRVERGSGVSGVEMAG